jgi:hypothetical protein
VIAKAAGDAVAARLAVHLMWGGNTTRRALYEQLD